MTSGKAYQSLIVDSQHLDPETTENKPVVLDKLIGQTVSTNSFNVVEFPSLIEAPPNIQQIVMMPLSMLVHPGTEHVPFYVSNSGELILASMKVNKVSPVGTIDSGSDACSVSANTALTSTITKSTQASNNTPKYPHKEDTLSSNEESENDSTQPSISQDPLSQKICKLLPRRQSNSPDVLVEDINISEIQRFAVRLRKRRRDWFISQLQLSNAITRQPDTPVVSQSFLCRFEKLDVTVRAASRLVPHLERWLSAAEHRLSLTDACVTRPTIANYRIVCSILDPSSAPKQPCSLMSRDLKALEQLHKVVLNPETPAAMETVTSSTCGPAAQGGECGGSSELVGREEVRKRKRRTCFSQETLNQLYHFFHNNAHPTGEELTKLAHSVNQNREVVRVWFCNKRQHLSRTQASASPPSNCCSGRNKPAEQDS